MTDVYRRLAERLDELPNGYPATQSGIEIKILRKIFTEEEAEIACALKLRPEKPDRIAERLGRDPETMREVLENMVERGEIGGVGPLGKRRYHLAPFVIGFYDFQVNRYDGELAELMEQYIEEGMLEGIGNNKPAFLHTIPIEQAIDAQLEIHPYESVRQLMEKAKVFAVRECICRKEKKALSNPCRKPEGKCIQMSSDEHAFDVDYLGHIVDREEAERIMKEAADAGLLHSTFNITDDTLHFCNCCTCCCILLRGVTQFNAPGVLAKSNFRATIDPEKCETCGTCTDKVCPTDAISEKNGTLEIDLERCLGCGVCVPVCPSESISLERKPPDECIQVPSNMVSWMIERSMDTGKSLDNFL